MHRSTARAPDLDPAPAGAASARLRLRAPRPIARCQIPLPSIRRCQSPPDSHRCDAGSRPVSRGLGPAPPRPPASTGTWAGRSRPGRGRGRRRRRLVRSTRSSIGSAARPEVLARSVGRRPRQITRGRALHVAGDPGRPAGPALRLRRQPGHLLAHRPLPQRHVRQPLPRARTRHPARKAGRPASPGRDVVHRGWAAQTYTSSTPVASGQPVTAGDRPPLPRPASTDRPPSPSGVGAASGCCCGSPISGRRSRPASTSSPSTEARSSPTYPSA